MDNWSKGDLLRLDSIYAKAGVAFHARPLHAAMNLLGQSFTLGGDDSRIRSITQAYKKLIPEVDTIWPGKGIGFAASVDRVRKVTVAVVFGSRAITTDKALGFDSSKEWIDWCRNDHKIIANSCFAFADIYDFTYGLDELQQSNSLAIEYWRMALSNLEDIANIFTTGFSVDTVIQPICLTAELAMKANLIHLGVDSKTLSYRDVGHKHTVLAQLMSETSPYRDDEQIATITTKLPDYVDSRYRAAGLTRLDVVNLALGVQFIAASSVRRLTCHDIAGDMERDNWPGPRKTFIE